MKYLGAISDPKDLVNKEYVDDSVVTYTISISSGVITLTGSDGSTSTVTLPIYNGGVQ